MAEDSDLERTEAATPKRIEKAREEGNVPRSRELATCGVLLAAGVALWMMSGQLSGALKDNLAHGLQFDRAAAYDPVYLLMRIGDQLTPLLLAFAPFALILLLVAIGTPALIGGWIMSGKAVAPKFSRMNPISGIGNLFSKNSAVELLKAIGKTLIVGSVGALVIYGDIGSILALPLQSVQSGITHTETLMLRGFLFTVGALVFIAAVDVPFQLKNYADKLKMTKEEVRQEAKETEGNPEIKARIRQQQREIARRRMMSEIPKADVIITNPTHYAVAIKYNDEGMRAPRVVAKGADAVALKIREIAGEHQVPVLESPKLARALYAHTDLGDEIPETLYAAVAEVLAYIFQMRVYRRQGGYQPVMPTALEVPDAMDPHHNTLATA